MKRIILALMASAAAITPAHADPLSIGVAFLVNIGYGGAISGLGATIIGSLILGAGAIGLQLLSSAIFTPTQQGPKPSDRQSTIRQAIGPRVRFYGRVKVGGTMWFFENAGGILYIGTTISEGLISSIEEIWLNDQQVTLDVNGYVANAPYLLPATGNSVARLFFKYGTADQTVFDVLDTAFSQVTDAHRLRGVAVALAQFQEVDAENVPIVYPNYVPQLRLVIHASVVMSVRTGVLIYSTNPADIIYDYLTAVDGAGFPYGAGYSVDEINLASFQNFAALCDEPVPLKAGGTERRYKLSGGYGLNEQMRTVLPRLLSACDANLYLGTDGKIAIRGGQFVEPTLVLDDTLGHIVSGEFRKGQNALAAFNELTITYTEPSLDYQEAEAQVWVDTENIALRGRVLPERLDVLFASSHAQARRLGKIFTHKNNPRWIGKIITNYYGMNAVTEETVRVKFSPLGIDESFAIQSTRILDGLTGVELTIASLSASAYDWDAATEEGEGPLTPPDLVDTIPPNPVNTVVATAGSGRVDFTWNHPSSANISGTRLYRNTVNNLVTASRIITLFGGPSVAMSHTDAVPAGTYYYWLVTVNGSGYEGTPVATGSKVVT